MCALKNISASFSRYLRYFGQDCEQDPDEEAPARVVSADEAVVVIDSQEDLKKVSAALQQNLQVLHAVQLHDGHSLCLV